MDGETLLGFHSWKMVPEAGVILASISGKQQQDGRTLKLDQKTPHHDVH